MGERDIPLRYTNLTEAREGHGERVDGFGRFLMRTDPLADAAVEALARLSPGKGRRMVEIALARGINAAPDSPAALKALFDALDAVPVWVDWEQMDLGGSAFRRCGIMGSLVLACHSLPLAYCSPAGSKPLIFSGGLVQRAARRLSETGRFVLETCMPGGLRRFSEGFKITVLVRLMHAQVRRLLWTSGRWDATAWGEPINQADMAATNLLLSVVALSGLTRLGFHFSRNEREGFMQLWRYSAYLSGIESDLLCATEAEGLRLWDLIQTTQGEPDEDSRGLARALMESGIDSATFGGTAGRQEGRREWLIRFCYGLSRSLIGKKPADGLHYPRSHWRFAAVPLLRAVVLPVELLQRAIPGGKTWGISSGTRVLRRVVETGLAGKPAEFRMPKGLAANAARRGL